MDQFNGCLPDSGLDQCFFSILKEPEVIMNRIIYLNFTTILLKEVETLGALYS